MTSIFLLFVFLIYLLPYIWVVATTRSLIFSRENLPTCHYALVLGAGLKENGQPTDILADRVLTSVSLIQSGKASILLMSGSARSSIKDEPTAMMWQAIKNGVNPSRIEIDRSGNSTFDSMVNIKSDKNAKDFIIVTQRFHLPRALWLAKSVGLNPYGFPADMYSFSLTKRCYWQIREIIALPFNWLKLVVHFSKNFSKNI